MTDSQTISDGNNTARNIFAAAAAVTAAVGLSAGSLEAAQAVAEPVVQDAFLNTVIALGYATTALGLTVGAATWYWWANKADPMSDPLEFTINKLRGKKDDNAGPSGP